MAFDAKAYFEESAEEFRQFWDDLHSGRLKGKIGVVEDGDKWIVLTAQKSSYDEVYGAPIEEKTDNSDKLKM